MNYSQSNIKANEFELGHIGLIAKQFTKLFDAINFTF